MDRRTFLLSTGPVLLSGRARGERASRPNILFAISDDQSFAHTGAMGDPVVRTPTFDRVAREGVLFRRAYCSSPSCTPSRGAILTGQAFWRLEQGANLWRTLPARFPVYPELLEAAGYHVGSTRKGCGRATRASTPRRHLSTNTSTAAGRAYSFRNKLRKERHEGTT